MASHKSDSIAIPVTVMGHKQRGGFYLDAKEVIPPFNEVMGKIPSRLSDDLHPNVVPRHPRHLTPIIHILLGFFQIVKVRNPAITIMLACEVLRLIPSQIRCEYLWTDLAKPVHRLGDLMHRGHRLEHVVVCPTGRNTCRAC